MSTHLESILKLIEQSQHMSAAEKESATQAVKGAEQELQEKNRDLQIESSLDRVRAAALSMKQPDDVLSICKIMFTELQSLGFSDLRNTLINFWDDAHGSLRDYDYSDFAGGHFVIIPYNTHPAFEKFQQRIRSSTDAFAELKISEDELESWKQRRRKDGEYEDPRLNNISALYYYFYSTGVGALGISTFSSLTEENLNVLKRFRNVFDFAYRRYMDVALAVAQAREAQIEVALERVRSKAMAMHQSDDLNSAVATVFEELDKLNLGVQRCGIGILNKETFKVDVWTTTVSDHGKTVQVSGDESMDIHPLLQGAYESWLRQEDFSYVLKGEDLIEYYRALTKTNFKLPDSVQITSSKEGQEQYYFNAMFQFGGLFAFRETEFPEEAKSVMKRFAGVFNLTYKRFLDIQQAEAQARDAQIEAALERVRASAMAMHTTDELKSVGEIIFAELKSLGFADIRNTEIIINNDEKETILSYYCDYGVCGSIEIGYETNPILHQWANDLKKASDAFVSVVITEKEMPAWRKFREEIGYRPDEKLNAASLVYYYSYSTGLGALSISSFSPISDEQMKMLGRFRNVFTLAYRRYVDVALAEAQAREAQIELALERVRARTMAMQKSDELHEVADVLFQQLRSFGGSILNAGFVLCKQDADEDEYWTSSDSGIRPVIFIPHTEDTVQKKLYEGWKNKLEFYSESMGGDELKAHYNYMVSVPSLKPFFDEGVDSNRSFPTWQKWHAAYFSHGYLFLLTAEEYDEEKILIRFAKIFEQAYTRFLDLQKAEAQAKEAQVEASLERVRSKAMAMHSSSHLTEAAGTLFTELNKLGINPIRTGFVLLTKDSRRAKLYPATSLDKKKTVSFTGEFEFIGHPVFEKQYESWQKHENYFPVLEGEVRKSYYQILSDAFSISFDQFATGDKQYGTFLPFSEGFLFTWSNEPYSKEEVSVLDRFKTILDLTIRRYLDLQKAEAYAIRSQIEEQKLREEKKRSDALLLNILPEEIANELKQFGKSYARKHEEVTVLFADIKGFSTIAENLSAEELVNQLDECFRAFDHIVDKHGLEKIKTVGDAYVCACGLPKPVPDNATKAVRAAFDMMNFIKGFAITKTIQDLPAFEFRIGIHTGPVITGVVGLKKFTYDIWGDAVNMAARMEQHGEAGKINISGNTYTLIKDKFTCTPRGKIPAKNKGEVEMYFVEHML